MDYRTWVAAGLAVFLLANPTLEPERQPESAEVLKAPLPALPAPQPIILAQQKASEVVAVIDGPAQSDPGDLIILDGSDSIGVDAAKWVLASQPPGVDKSRSLLAVDGGMRAVFASGTSGQYKFLLSVAGVVEGKAQLSIATHVLTIGTPTPGPQPPGPQPPGPTPPPVLTGWAKFAYDNALSIVASSRGKASELASNMESVGSALAAGAYGTGPEIDQIAAALSVLTIKNRETLPPGPFREAWTPWLTAWASKASTDLKGKSKADHVTAFQETAKGLKEIH